MSTYKILVSDKLHPSAIEWLSAQADVEVTSDPTITPEDLATTIADYDALIVRSRTKVRTELIGMASNLKVIGRAGSGLDNIDVDVANAKGIRVLNSPGANANAVAELAIGYMIALARNFSSNFEATEKPKTYGWELRDKTLGIIGLGQIGGRVASLASAFGMNLIGYDVIDGMVPSHVSLKRVELPELFESSDVITLHVPILDATRHLINEKAISSMRDGTSVINSARADIVDENAVLTGLESGKLGAYAADAVGLEELRSHPNVIHTPPYRRSDSRSSDSSRDPDSRECCGCIAGQKLTLNGLPRAFWLTAFSLVRYNRSTLCERFTCREW